LSSDGCSSDLPKTPKPQFQIDDSRNYSLFLVVN